jgi:hypothetical protein
LGSCATAERLTFCRAIAVPSGGVWKITVPQVAGTGEQRDTVSVASDNSAPVWTSATLSGGGASPSPTQCDMPVPASGRPGDKITISGSNLGGTGAVVLFNGIFATVSYGDDHSITVDVPPGASTGPVLVNGVPCGTFTYTSTAIADGKSQLRVTKMFNLTKTSPGTPVLATIFVSFPFVSFRCPSTTLRKIDSAPPRSLTR